MLQMTFRNNNIKSGEETSRWWMRDLLEVFFLLRHLGRASRTRLNLGRAEKRMARGKITLKVGVKASGSSIQQLGDFRHKRESRELFSKLFLRSLSRWASQPSNGSACGSSQHCKSGHALLPFLGLRQCEKKMGHRWYGMRIIFKDVKRRQKSINSLRISHHRQLFLIP